jgi:hypothetical protein
MIMTRSGLNATAGYICREQWTLHSKLIIVLSAVVALTTANLRGLDVDREALLGGLSEREVADAAVMLAGVLADNALMGTGPVILRAAGQVAAWINAGGGNDH